MAPDTIDKLITAHRALYELRMEGKLVTNYLHSDVAQALNSIGGHCGPHDDRYGPLSRGGMTDG